MEEETKSKSAQFRDRKEAIRRKDIELGLIDDPDKSKKDNMIWTRPKKRKKKRHELEGLMTLILETLKNQCLVVELKNNSSIFGKLISVDKHMNLEMIIEREGEKESSSMDVLRDDGTLNNDQIYIKGTSIKMVHIPSNYDYKKETGSFLKACEMNQKKGRTKNLTGR